MRGRCNGELLQRALDWVYDESYQCNKEAGEYQKLQGNNQFGDDMKKSINKFLYYADINEIIK